VTHRGTDSCVLWSQLRPDPNKGAGPNAAQFWGFSLHVPTTI